MMLRVGILILGLFAAVQAVAAPARVSSGDHPDFTRIVIEYTTPVDWSLGRTAAGYELRLAGETPQYDLSKVFELIGKDRLAAIWADPETGALHFGVACACFAMPFEFRPGTIVVDIRKGLPPKSSSFEQPLDGGTAAELSAPQAIRPRQRPADAPPEPDAGAAPLVYDWTTSIGLNSTERAGATFAEDLSTKQSVTLDLEPLRQSLVEQLSRGASQGIVDMAKPKFSESMPETEGNPSVEIRLGDAPNLVIRQKGETPEPLTAGGAKCIADERLNVEEWAEDTPIAEQMGPVMSDLIGEFDKPNPEAVKKAVQFYLSISFGAEARALLRAFPTEQEDEAIWNSMAYILDGETDPEPAFAGMAACDTNAALWSVLADPEPIAVGQVEKAAILRAFSNLPNHLRRELGPTMVERFLAMQDLATAIVLRDAVLRGTADPGPEIELMQAAIEKAGGSPSASIALLEPVVAESGPSTAEALAALIIQRAEIGQEVNFDQVTTLEEYTKESEGSEDADKFNHALTLGYAASGDFEKAFARLDMEPASGPIVWQLLGSAGPDTALITFATLERGQAPPSSAKGAASLIATRMLKLGLADQAEKWLNMVEAPPTLLAARVRLATGNPQEALDMLEGDTSNGAFPVRVEALRELGDEKGLADLFAAEGMTEDQWQTISRMQDWNSLAEAGPDVWKAAAQKLIDDPMATTAEPTDPQSAAEPPGPLAQSQALIDNSAGTRDAIEALLNSVRSPDAPSQ